MVQGEDQSDLFGASKQKQLFDSDDDDAVPTGPSTTAAPVEPAVKVIKIVGDETESLAGCSKSCI